MKKKYTVKEAIEFLSQFGGDAQVTGFGMVKVVPVRVSVKAGQTTPATDQPQQ